MNRRKTLLPLLVLSSLTFAQAQDIRSGEDLLRAMHDRYVKSWYATLTFDQKSTTYNTDGTTKVETWHEAAEPPRQASHRYRQPI